MFKTLKIMYLGGELTIQQLEHAVQKKWITEEQFKEIVSLKIN